MGSEVRADGRLTTAVEPNGSVSRIELAGRLDRSGDDALSAAWASATASDPTTVELDFERVDYINSTGIALVVGVLAEARRDGIEVRGTGLSDHYREIFTITRLSDFMTIVDETEGSTP